tara:strand:- start:47 stop:223 length:177 start_codon:yes stop_codon:yes gene_type:complete
MKNKILEAIPVIGSILFIVGLISLFLAIWSDNPIFNLRITLSSAMGVLFLRLLEISLK